MFFRPSGPPGARALAKTATSSHMTIGDWLTDSKIVLIIAAWLLLGLVLLLWWTVKLKGKTVAYATIVAFALILFAVVGTSVFCNSEHDFSTNRQDNTDISGNE